MSCFCVKEFGLFDAERNQEGGRAADGLSGRAAGARLQGASSGRFVPTANSPRCERS